jgi:hypothetical protein
MFCNDNDNDNNDNNDGYSDIDTDIYYPVKKHSFFCRNRNDCSCKYYATNYMVKMYYPVINHSFFCLNRKANNYACSCNYGITYKIKYVHCSEVKSPYDLYSTPKVKPNDFHYVRALHERSNQLSNLEKYNLQKYYFWLLKENEKIESKI